MAETALVLIILGFVALIALMLSIKPDKIKKAP